MAFNDISSIVLEVAFHIWVIMVLVNLLRSRIELNRVVKAELTKTGILRND